MNYSTECGSCGSNPKQITAAILLLFAALISGCQENTQDGRHDAQTASSSTIATAALPVVAPAGAYLEDRGMVVMEAEDFDANLPRSGQSWVLTRNPSASGAAVLSANPNLGVIRNVGYVTDSPQLNFDVQFKVTGTYYLWIRGAGPTSNDDSCHAGIDEVGSASAASISGFGKVLAWKRKTMEHGNATLTVAQAGVHTINVWMREDGFRIDKLLLTKDPHFVPVGAGPAPSSRNLCTAAAECDDANPCTDDTCSNGACAHVNNAVACDDGNACTTGDICAAGACTAGLPVSCDDVNPCTDDTCSNGACAHVDNAAACDDGNACTTGDVCAAGACTAGLPVSCDDANPCTVDTCTAGACSNQPLCNDHNPCSDDQCNNGVCLFVGNGTCNGPRQYQESSGMVVIEAENFDHNVVQGDHTWNLLADPLASNGNVMNANPNSGIRDDTTYVSTSPRLDFDIQFVTPGTYYVWIRAVATTAEDDSCHAGIDGTTPSSAAKISWYTTALGWSKKTTGNANASLSIPSAGLHTLNVWMREDGFRIDKIVLTTSSTYTPSGVGPDSSPRSGCNENEPNNFPGNAEACDGHDNDCNGLADFSGESVDLDRDGVPSCSDCDDSDPNNFPGNAEVCDGHDNDCNGLADSSSDGEVDSDGDGSPACVDCDDADPRNRPGQAELCDGHDNDCNGLIDADAAGEVDNDGDGQLSCVDCNDHNTASNAQVTFLLHGPPTALADVTADVRLSGTGAIGNVLLETVAKLTWSATITVPFRSTATYHWARTESDATVEVGPWGEPLSERRLNVDCNDVVIEDAVWNWDDLTANGPAPPADKGPTLSVTGDASTSATISLELATAADATLHYSTESNVYSAESVVVGTGQRRYEFALNGLLPGTTYYYYVEYAGRLTSESHFTTSATTGVPFRFVAYGDSQDQAGHEVHRNIVAQAYAFHPNVVIRTGDNVETGATLSLWDYFFAIERPLLGSAVYLTELGNHEAQAANYFNLFALPPAPANEQYYAVRYDSTLFIGLSTETTITGAQTTWLGDTLTAANADPTIRWKVAYFHQPPYSSGFHGSNTTIRSTWHPLFRDRGVNVVFNGHDHDFEHSLVEGVHYLVIGGGGSDLRSVGTSSFTVHSESVNHLVVVDVTNQHLAATALRTDGTTMDAFTLTAH